MEQSMWSNLCREVFGDLFLKCGFVWQSELPQGHGLRIVVDAWGHSGLTRWACAKKDELSLVIMLDVRDAVIYVEFFWGPNQSDRIEIGDVKNIYSVSLSNLIENDSKGFSVGSFCGKMQSKHDSIYRYFAERLESEKQLLLRDCGELLTGNYKRYTKVG